MPTTGGGGWHYRRWYMYVRPFKKKKKLPFCAFPALPLRRPRKLRHELVLKAHSWIIIQLSRVFYSKGAAFVTLNQKFADQKIRKFLALKLNAQNISQNSSSQDPTFTTTRRFLNHVSRLLSRSHTFAIIVILDLKIHQSMWVHWPFFPKNLNQRSLTPRWPLTPCLLRSHVWLYPRIIMSKSHDNTSM